MSIQRLTPYFITIIIFAFIYWITMTFPWFGLPAGRDTDWAWLMRKNRILLQQDIFVFGLTVTLLVINVFEIILVKNNNFLFRLLKSILTIILVILTCRGVYWLMGEPPILNLYYYYRGIPARITCIMCILLTFFCLIILELIQRVLLSFIPRESIVAYIPRWLRLEK